MENSKPNRPLNQMMRVFCFVLGSIFAAPAIWLCLRGRLPDIPIDGATFVPIDGIAINGVPVGRWAFYLIVTGLFITAIILWFAGWRVGRVRTHEALRFR